MQTTIYKNFQQHEFKPYYLCPHLHSCFTYDLNDYEITNFMKIVGHPKYLSPGDLIRRENQAFHDLYVVKSGSIKDSSTSEDGDEKVADFYLPGEIIGLEDISNGSALYDSIALESSSVWAIPFDPLLRLCEQIPKLRHRLVMLTSQKLMLRTRNHLACHDIAEQRVTTFLLNLYHRYRSQNNLDTQLHLSMTRQEIGSHLNLTPETVSRTLSKLQREGLLVADKKHITLLDLGNNHHPHHPIMARA